jgi:hypothetical protein
MQTYLCHEHCSRRDFHVVTKFEVLQESYSLCHAYVPINLKAHVSYWISRIDVPNYILCDNVQSW